MICLFTPLLTAGALILFSYGAGAQPQADTSNPPPQTQSGERQKTLSQAELEQLVAPIALYSDALLARVLMASTHPLEVVKASRWVEQNKSLQGSELLAAADNQRWDYSVRQLTAMPSVLAMMSDKLDWTEKLGDAVLAQQPDVLDAVQRVRAVAQAQDKLDEQKVARRTEDVGAVAQAPQPDTSNPPPQTQAGEGQEQRATVTQAQDKLTAINEQEVARGTEDNRDIGAVAQAPQPDTPNPPPQTRSSEPQETFSTSEQKVARRTGDNRDVVGALAPPPQTQSGEPPETSLQKRASNKQVKHAGPSQKRLAQQRPANLSANRGGQIRERCASVPFSCQLRTVSQHWRVIVPIVAIAVLAR
jgi:hypothetical protein